MGLLSWLSPSPEKKLAKARAHLMAGRWADARLDALDLGDLPGAGEIVEQAEEALARLNLATAESWAQAGDDERVAHHLELAAEFAPPHVHAELVQMRAHIRAMQRERAHDAQLAAHKEAERLAEVNEGFRGTHLEDQLALPEGIGDDEAEAMKARLAMLIDAYPESLRGSVLDLGAAFTQAVFDLEDGHHEAALGALMALPDDNPLVLHERARAAWSLRDPAAAARAWRAFAERAGGHHVIGQHHTGVLLAQALVQSGSADEAHGLLVALRKQDKTLGAGLYAGVLEARGELAEAEAVLREMLRTFGAQPPIYVALARVRVKGGHRVAAMQALEKSLSQTVCEPGRCGYRPPDLDTYRMLATLYLEDGLERDRALELAETAHGLVQQPVWEDLYLAALVARARQDGGWTSLADRLRQVTATADPRVALLEAHLTA
ncbi:MAG: hypothetical protein H6733_09995 [Alphaproteobacteria bacterium]|nr:hypothetical protein [Alphaproteobacteria bacterium]